MWFIKHTYTFLWWLLLGMMIFLTFNRHSRAGYFNYHSQIWADKAGYYAYLPAFLLYDGKADQFPDSIDVRTGNGFRLDMTGNRMITKYSYGTALMLTPVFIVAHLMAPFLGQPDDGFAPVYHMGVDVAAVIYLMLALMLLFRWLNRRYGKFNTALGLLAVLAGTNLFYYGIDETGMSHVYSFFLFSLWLYLMTKTDYLLKANRTFLLLMGAVAGLMVAVRPSNIIFVSTYFFLDINQASVIGDRLKNLLKGYRLPWLLTGFVIMIIPQLFYWHYAYGSYLYYSYGAEGFTWSDPHLILFWFSPNNGLLLYTPMVLVLLTALVFMLWQHKAEGWYISLLFLLLSYVFSSWSTWHFGCSFGARSMVEYWALFALPLVWLLHEVRKRKAFGMLIVVLVLLMVWNIKLSYAWDDCYFGRGNWDWDFFKSILFKAV